MEKRAFLESESLSEKKKKIHLFQAQETKTRLE